MSQYGNNSMVHNSSESGVEYGAVLWIDEHCYFITTNGINLLGHTVLWRKSPAGGRKLNTIKLVQIYRGGSTVADQLGVLTVYFGV